MRLDVPAGVLDEVHLPGVSRQPRLQRERQQAALLLTATVPPAALEWRLHDRAQVNTLLTGGVMLITFILEFCATTFYLQKLLRISQSEKASSIQYGYRKCGTRARVV